MSYRLSQILFVMLVLNCSGLTAQHQLLLVNGNKVVHRFKVGEPFRTKWKGDKYEHWGLIVDVNEFTVITSQDTININRVSKVLLPGRPLINKIGKTLITVGVAYLFIDQFNWVVVQGNDPTMDDSVWKPAAILVGAGVPMVFIKKKWGKIKRGTRLVSVGKSSRFFTYD